MTTILNNLNNFARRLAERDIDRVLEDGENERSLTDVEVIIAAYLDMIQIPEGCGFIGRKAVQAYSDHFERRWEEIADAENQNPNA